MTEPTREELLALIARLRAELWNYWEAYHSEHCTGDWPHPPGQTCYYPPPPEVSVFQCGF